METCGCMVTVPVNMDAVNAGARARLSAPVTVLFDSTECQDQLGEHYQHK